MVLFGCIKAYSLREAYERTVNRRKDTCGATARGEEQALDIPSVGVISKVLRILEVWQTSSVGLGLKAICDETGINKNTAHRFLRHLERESYLLRTEAGSYLIGPRLA
jgi:hypothetical protein